MRRTFVLLLVCLSMLALQHPATATTPPPPVGGADWDRSWHNRPMYRQGNPTDQAYKRCRARMAGPYPSKADVHVQVARFRVECFTKEDTFGLGMIGKLWNKDGGYGDDTRGDCFWNKHPKYRFTGRKDSSDHTWWGCTSTVKVRDENTGKSEAWYAWLYGTDEAFGADESVNFQTIVSYCKNHTTWCREHPGKVAISWSAL